MEECKLYIVPTPIGNLDDMTYRAVEVLKNVDIIACEDTRHTRKLLDYFGIKNRLISYHEHNEKESSEGIVEEIFKGKTIALVSDAGMPLISDPGHKLVQKLIEENINFTVLPGASATVTALVASGMNNDSFQFLGFFPTKKSDFDIFFDKILSSEIASICYESPHRIKNTLRQICPKLGDRKISVLRELTKIYEDYIYFKASEFNEDLFLERGEFVVVIEGKEKDQELPEDFIVSQLEKLSRLGYSDKDAVKLVSDMNGIKKNLVYKINLRRSIK